MLLFGEQFLFGLGCSELGFVSFVAELDETFVNLVERGLGRTHTQGLSFNHERFELGTNGQRIFLGGKVVGLLDEGFAFAEQEGCCLLTAILGFLGCTELFCGHLADGGVLGVLTDVLECVFGFNAFECCLGDAFLGIAVCGVGEERLLGALLHEFESKFRGLHGLHQFFGIAGVLEFVQVRNHFGGRSFAEIFQLLGDFFKIACFGKTADCRFGVVLRDLQKYSDNIQFLDSCGPHFLVFVAQGDVFKDVLMLGIQLVNRLDAFFGLGILPFRFKCVQ